MIRNSRRVRLGANSNIDKAAIIGYRPSRAIEHPILTIGDRCVIRSGSVIYLGSKLGRNFETGHNVTIREEVVIGDFVKVWSNSVIDYRCRIGSNVKIHTGCYISQLTRIDDEVFLAPGVLIANEKYPTGNFSLTTVRGAHIEEGAKLGMGSIILPGLTVGRYSTVGAGSVVTKDVPSHKIVYGVPARVIKEISGDSR